MKKKVQGPPQKKEVPLTEEELTRLVEVARKVGCDATSDATLEKKETVPWLYAEPPKIRDLREPLEPMGAFKKRMRRRLERMRKKLLPRHGD